MYITYKMASPFIEKISVTHRYNQLYKGVERKTRFELATFSLARRCSTTEPLPHYNSVPRGRIELPTPAFSVLCSTTELPRRLDYFTKFNLLGIYDLWARQGSNLRPIGYEPTALPLSYRPQISSQPILLNHTTQFDLILSKTLQHNNVFFKI